MKILLSLFKKTSKFILSKAIYIFIGIFVALTVYVVQAAIPSKTSGDLLTAGDWNELAGVVNSLDDSVNDLQANALTLADVKNYLENNCYVCLGWGDLGNQWDDTTCKKFGEGWGAIFTDGIVDDNDVFGIRSYCN